MKYGKYILLVSLFSLFCITPRTFSKFSTSKVVEGSIVVPEDNYCIKNGFNTLSDCMLVMESYASSVDDAKKWISDKGEPDFSKVSPEVIYSSQNAEVSKDTGILNFFWNAYISKSYSFDSNTGYYKLGNYISVGDDFSNSYLDYYVCSDVLKVNECREMYQIKEINNVDENGVIKHSITKAVRYNTKIVETIDNTIGLFSTKDDLGTSYYYRGSVKNNYVSFAGYTWRIVRENGDGSVRLIYANNNSSLGNYAFNKSHLPLYNGYMYDDTDLEKVSYPSTPISTEKGKNYIFATSYVENDDHTFTLNGDMISSNWDDYNNNSLDSYAYTCFNTSNENCMVLYTDLRFAPREPTIAYTTAVTYNAASYEKSLENNVDSNIKKALDDWYENKLVDKVDDNNNLITDYISDGIFCNDRTLFKGNGLSLTAQTYSGCNRLYNLKSPSVTCTRNEDKFTTTNDLGNGKLKYPISLITADEVYLAGALTDSDNTNFYLYTGKYSFTMTPAIFHPYGPTSNIFVVGDSGKLVDWWSGSLSAAIYPVINIKSSVKITGGDGTSNNPFTLGL